MSNFICPTYGFNNIDCGKAGYKTAREIELEKKLDIAVKALKKYADTNNWGLGLFNNEVRDFFKVKLINGFDVAKKALKEIEG